MKNACQDAEIKDEEDSDSNEGAETVPKASTLKFAAPAA